MKNSFEDLIAEGVKYEIEARLGFLLSQVFKEQLPSSLVRKLGYDLVRSEFKLSKDKEIGGYNSFDQIYVVGSGSVAIVFRKIMSVF